ncbi:hypothetical protein NMT69_24980, partial [Escherichia coli]|nr:hypothetical protein [Escherichia coli]
MKSWRNTRGGDASDDVPAEKRREGNAALLDAIERMDAVRLPLDANDVDLRERAAQVAAMCQDLGQAFP